MGALGSEPSTNFADFLRQCGRYAVLDGGLATELERHGANLNDPLWSAKCLISSPHLIRRVHLDYLEAGANIIITASYQATIQGFEAKGIDRKEAETLLKRSVEIAMEARDIYNQKHGKSTGDVMGNLVQPILVAASVGSYGAYLADGSEYSRNYGPKVSKDTLKNFHRRRVQVLANAGADLIAFETIPSKLEAEVTSLSHLHIFQSLIFFSLFFASGKTLAGSCWRKKAQIFLHGLHSVQPTGSMCLVAIRYNHVRLLLIQVDLLWLLELTAHLPDLFMDSSPPFERNSCFQVTDKAVLVYPNSGEKYDAELKRWVKSTGDRDEADFVSHAGEWCQAGASLVGGCCRTTPNTSKAISRALHSESFCLKIPQLQ